MPTLHPDLLKQFHSRFPRIGSLRLHPVAHSHGYHQLLDSEDVKGLLGEDRYGRLLKSVKQVYSVGHRNYDQTHLDPHFRGAEVHCIAAEDLEAFLAGGN